MTDLTKSLTRKLTNLFGYEQGIMLGRARSGVVALVEILQQDRKTPLPVIVPENICAVLVAAIHAGGGQAVPVPVSPETGLPTDHTFVTALKSNVQKGIVMPTHLYGFQGDYPETITYARQNGWFILENDTNAVQMGAGKNTGGSPAFGDGLLVSFGYAKPIEAGGGGVFLTQDPSLALNMQEKISKYPPLTAAARTQEENCMLDRRTLRNSQASPDQKETELERIFHQERTLCRYRYEGVEGERLMIALENFPLERERRLKRKEIWDRTLAPLDDFLLPVPLAQPVPWRVIRRVPVHRDLVAQTLWRHKIDAGINYRSLWREVPAAYLCGSRPLTDVWGDTVLNLWVTEGYDENRIAQAGRYLREIRDAI